MYHLLFLLFLSPLLIPFAVPHHLPSIFFFFTLKFMSSPSFPSFSCRPPPHPPFSILLVVLLSFPFLFLWVTFPRQRRQERDTSYNGSVSFLFIFFMAKHRQFSFRQTQQHFFFWRGVRLIRILFFVFQDFLLLFSNFFSFCTLFPHTSLFLFLRSAYSSIFF